MRDAKDSALPFIRNRKYRPKPVTIKEKTSKLDPSLGLVTCRLQDFDGDVAAFKKAVASVKSRGYGLKDGIVVDKRGRPFYSDYDLHGIYRADGSPLPLTQISNTRGFQDKINAAMDRSLSQLQRKVQHGAHDDWRWLKLQNRDKSAYERAVAESLEDPHFRTRTNTAHRADYDPLPPVTVYHPDGGLTHLRTVAEMKSFYQDHGIYWPYGQ